MDVSNKNFFEITRRGQRDNKSVTLPNAAANEGIAFQESATQADKTIVPLAELASGAASPALFVTAPVTTTVPVPTIAELAGGEIPLSSVVSPFRAGQEGTLEAADEYVAEGSDYIYSAGGASDITPATAARTRCSFIAGKTCKATTGQYSEFMLAEQLTPITAGQTRCRFVRIDGVLIP